MDGTPLVVIRKLYNGNEAKRLLDQLRQRPKLAGAFYEDRGETVELGINEPGLSHEAACAFVEQEIGELGDTASFHLLVVRDIE
jgi:hypothetical protein